ncbi:hypothetical protein BU23DRAFT_600807 [Bimuria novae-zelandiae CBS 107.79]|uniref:Uncharacterized protein n=1 Tax=Bimuria novae-zelandiae CBS 107.79 TaxID=1447943 RepID=A0A6A5V1D7_9PLEO|nr:hypothetical protein BU23DRAFT_600807 [Bimuria novae-zelandiae CBS 107.79]
MAASPTESSAFAATFLQYRDLFQANGKADRLQASIVEAHSVLLEAYKTGAKQLDQLLVVKLFPEMHRLQNHANPEVGTRAREYWDEWCAAFEREALPAIYRYTSSDKESGDVEDLTQQLGKVIERDQWVSEAFEKMMQTGLHFESLRDVPISQTIRSPQSGEAPSDPTSTPKFFALPTKDRPMLPAKMTLKEAGTQEKSALGHASWTKLATEIQAFELPDIQEIHDVAPLSAEKEQKMRDGAAYIMAMIEKVVEYLDDLLRPGISLPKMRLRCEEFKSNIVVHLFGAVFSASEVPSSSDLVSILYAVDDTSQEVLKDLILNNVLLNIYRLNAHEDQKRWSRGLELWKGWGETLGRIISELYRTGDDTFIETPYRIRLISNQRKEDEIEGRKDSKLWSHRTRLLDCLARLLHDRFDILLSRSAEDLRKYGLQPRTSYTNAEKQENDVQIKLTQFWNLADSLKLPPEEYWLEPEAYKRLKKLTSNSPHRVELGARLRPHDDLFKNYASRSSRKFSMGQHQAHNCTQKAGNQTYIRGLSLINAQLGSKSQQLAQEKAKLELELSKLEKEKAAEIAKLRKQIQKQERSLKEEKVSDETHKNKISELQASLSTAIDKEKAQAALLAQATSEKEKLRAGIVKLKTAMKVMGSELSRYKEEAAERDMYKDARDQMMIERDEEIQEHRKTRIELSDTKADLQEAQATIQELKNTPTNKKQPIPQATQAFPHEKEIEPRNARAETHRLCNIDVDMKRMQAENAALCKQLDDQATASQGTSRHQETPTVSTSADTLAPEDTPAAPSEPEHPDTSRLFTSEIPRKVPCPDPSIMKTTSSAPSPLKTSLRSARVSRRLRTFRTALWNRRGRIKGRVRRRKAMERDDREFVLRARWSCGCIMEFVRELSALELSWLAKRAKMVGYSTLMALINA